jgi:MFS family permease
VAPTTASGSGKLPGLAAHPARPALVAAFVANGLGIPGFLARLADRQDELGLSDAALGVTILGTSLGALAISPFCGALVQRFTSRRVTVAAGTLLGAGLWAAGAAPSAPALFAVLAALGAADAAMDVSMNANGAAYEGDTGRSTLHGLHAAWSIGALCTGGIAAAAASADVSPTVQLAVVGAIVASLALWSSGGLVDHDPAPPPADAADANDTARRRSRLPMSLLVLAAAVVAGALLEGTATDWSAVQLDRLGASDGLAPLGFAAFMGGMVVGRLVGDRATDRHGAATVLRRGMALCAVGLVAGAAIGEPLPFCIGVAIAGYGLSGFFPAAFSAASRTPGVRAGTGAAAVSLAARAGFLLEPVVVGTVADATDLRVSFAIAGGLALLIAAAAPRFLRD